MVLILTLQMEIIMTTNNSIKIEILDDINYEGLGRYSAVISWSITNNLNIKVNNIWSKCIKYALNAVESADTGFSFYVLLYRKYRKYGCSRRISAYKLEQEKIYKYLHASGIDISNSLIEDEILVGNKLSEDYGYLALCSFSLISINNFFNIRKELDKTILIAIPKSYNDFSGLKREIGEIFTTHDDGGLVLQKWGGKSFLEAMIKKKFIVFNPFSHCDEPVLEFLGIAYKDIIYLLLK